MKRYDYSLRHRVIEVFGILTLIAMSFGIAWTIADGLRGQPEAGWWLLPSAVLLGYLGADFISGFVHFLADRFFSESTPVIGQNFVKPFRDHHRDPTDIAKHDFIETNGNNSLISIAPLGFLWWWLPSTELWGLFGLVTALSMALGVLATNQIHKWAHMEAPPRYVRGLQKRRLILSPAHHDVHHRPPHDANYCITTGWLNPILRGVGFFPRAEAVLSWVLPSARSTK